MIFKMAWRNLFRHKKRTILTLVTMTIGIMAAIIGEGINSGMYTQIKKTFINSSFGYYTVYKKGFYDDKISNNILEFPIEDEKKFLDSLKNKKYSERLSFGGTLTDSIYSLNVNFIGVDKERENNVFSRDKYMLEGSFELGDKSIVIGSDLARILNLNIGSEVVIIARTAEQSINAYDVKIEGIIKTGNPFMDSAAVFLNLNFAKDFVLSENINNIVVGQKLSEDFLAEIDSKEDRIVSIEEEMSGIEKVVEVRKKFFGIVSGAILTMAALSIANTMLMSMMERHREIGIMMAGGMKRGKILNLFLLEGTISGILGGLLGFCFGSIMVLYYQKYGMYIGDISDLGSSLPISERLFFNYNLSKALFYVCISFICAVAASFYPAYKATKLNPIEIFQNN